MTQKRERSRAHLARAAEARRRGDREAERAGIARAIAADPADALARLAAAELAEATGDAIATRTSLERAVALDPHLAQAWQLLGILRGESGDAQGALVAFAHAVAIEPASARAFNNLGNALRTLGRTDDAQAAFARAVDLKPDYVLAIANLAASRRDAGDFDEALRLARLALGHNPPPALRRTALIVIAGILRERGTLDEAVAWYEEAIRLAPSASGAAWVHLGQIHVERDDVALARSAFQRAREVDRRELRGAIGAALALPMIHSSAAAMQAARDVYVEGLATLERGVESLVRGLTAGEVLDGLRWSNFLLAYHGRDDRALQQRYAGVIGRALATAAPDWRRPAPARPRSVAPGPVPRRVRVGFASSFFRDGTVGRYFRSWITDLPRERFEVHVYHLHPVTDALTSEIRARADAFGAFQGTRARPSVVAPAIRADALDVLVYPELGMDHVSFALAGLRLARCQLAGWGHPVTTGHATIDGFISCETMEPENGASHYVERLMTLPGIGTRYRGLPLPRAESRAKFGLPESGALLLCPQSLFKIHPDNDGLFATVLAANPATRLVVFEWRHPRVTKAFVDRLRGSLDEHGVAPDRLVVLPALDHDDYLRVNLLCDAMLDTLYWSGGNTSLDALACGLPVVTLPGAFMRGRQSAAMLGLAGVAELVAKDRDDYVGIASRLVRDPRWRIGLAERILAGRANLFDRTEPIDALIGLLERAAS